jgi:curli biogenesis system outer membrane secretion channel CsgG
MMRVVRLGCLLAVAGMVLMAQQKKRVAVLDFDYATVQSASSAVFGTNVDIGKGIADMLIERLVKDGTYSVIERKALDKVLAEQNFSNSSRADSTSAAKLARILGVDAIIIGSITQFGRDDKKTGVGGGGFGGFGSKYGLGGVSHHSAKAVVGITARIINTDTAEILVAATGDGESSRSGTSLLGAGGGGGNGGGGAVDMSSSNFANTLIGEATGKAVTQLATQLEQGASRVQGRAVVINGLVADVAGKSLVLNIGSRAGLKVGDHVSIERKIRDVKDPSTGKILRSIEDKLGDAVITEVEEGSSTATFNGSGDVKVGDAVKGAQ